VEHASTVDHLRQKHGLTVENIVARVQDVLAERAEQAARHVGRLAVV
jgi:hypothetical protein